MTTTLATKESSHSRFIVEFVIYSVYLIFGMAWATTGSVTPQIMQDFGLNMSYASMMTNVILWAKIAGTVSTAIITYKLGIKRSYALGCFLIGTSILIPMVDSFPLLLVIRFLNGFGGAICLVCLVPVVNQHFDSKTAPSVNSFNGTSNVIGAILALLLASKLSGLLGGWQNLLASYGFIVIVLLGLWLTFYKDKQAETNQAQSVQNDIQRKIEIKTALTSRVTWGMVLQYVGAILMMTAAFTYFPTYYAKYANLPADSLSSYSPSVNQFGLLLGAFLSAKLKSMGIHYKKMFLVTSLTMVATTFAMLFATNDVLILVCSFLTGLLLASWFSFIFSLPKEEIKNATTNTTTYVMSTFWFCTFTIATINSQIISYSIDATGGFTVGFSYIFGLMIICPLLAQLVFPKKKDK